MLITYWTEVAVHVQHRHFANFAIAARCYLRGDLACHRMRPALRRVTPALRLRGGDLVDALAEESLSRAEFTHSVFCSILSNALVVLAVQAVIYFLRDDRSRIMRALPELRERRKGGSSPPPGAPGARRKTKAALVQKLNPFAVARDVLTPALVIFVALFIVYALTGFVPMGYVVGSAPLVPFFRPPAA